MGKKYTTESFVAKSIEKFGNVLDYSLTRYVNSNSFVCLICNVHGEFYQKPDVHLAAKHPCPKCSKRIPTKEDLISRFSDVHGKKYDYSLVEYKSFNDSVKIVCPFHGIFEQIVNAHIQGKGCRACAGNSKYTIEDFILKAKLAHGDLYDYSLVDYVNNNTVVKIICSKHGVFEQTPANHYKYGCIICSGKYLKTNFVKEASIVHNNRYDYSLVDYKGMFEKVKIICPIHGVFEQIPSNHLHHKKGCAKCVGTISRGETEWLDLLGVIKRQINIMADGKRFRVDGYDPNTNTIYEYNGDFWHGNPKMYNMDDKIYFGVTFGDLYKRTTNKESILRSAGYNVISIWESDFVTGNK